MLIALRRLLASVRTSGNAWPLASAIRAACANERSCRSLRGAISDGRPYRDLKSISAQAGEQ